MITDTRTPSEESYRLRVLEERLLVIALEDDCKCEQTAMEMLPAWLTTHEGTLSEQGRILAQAIADRNDLRFLCRDYEKTRCRTLSICTRG